MCGSRGAGACINGKAVYINGKIAGLNKMYDIFEELYGSGRRPENISGEELIKELSSCNYIPPGLEEEYREVALKEYQIFCKEKGGEKMEDRKRSKEEDLKTISKNSERCACGCGCTFIQQ